MKIVTDIKMLFVDMDCSATVTPMLLRYNMFKHNTDQNNVF